MTDQKPLRAFVNRDYSKGVEPRFESSPMPVALEGLLDAEVFRHTIEGINYHFEAAEQHTSALYWRNFANCLTGYVGDFCLANPYDKHLNAMSAYVEEQNSSVYNPRGLALINPLDRGLRVIEITNLPGKAVVLEKSSV
eukprot:m.191942 g.191942  ORF g.191942 m.191942 type:complete len:139 (+) comp18505_c0_seq1:96-512(+)